MIALGLIETQGLIAAIEAADAMLKAANVYLLERTCVGSGLVTITIASEDVGSVSAAVEAGAAAVKRIPGAILISKHVIPRPDLELHTILKLTPPPSFSPPSKPSTQNGDDSKSLENKNQNNSVELSDTTKTKLITPKQDIEVKPNIDAKENIDIKSNIDAKENIEKNIKAVVARKVTTKIPARLATNVASTKNAENAENMVNVENAHEKKQTTPIRYTMAKLKTMKLDKLQEIAHSLENFPLSSDIIATANRDRLITEFMKIFK